ncbi:hypothetical protein KUTeg_009163 [Tegillarca granosa]|uniref:Beta-galactosidase galactose-binding domain-containing protein n=1 Tax=Tegillarca granosa TaxID=220873 RepID=A0ABQ9FAJ0_TEGGR|nr:hypothetical protein KUTeg_009163 [Tegillarca granosa]
MEKFNPADGIIGSGPKYNGNLITPSLYVGKLTIPVLELNDTYFDMSSWSKGQLFINHNNVGRYWPVIGPQVRLYIPKPFLQAQKPNYVVMFELENAPCQTPKTCFAEFVDKPFINAPTHGPDIQISDRSQYYKFYGLDHWKFGTGHDRRRVDFPNYFPAKHKTRN